MKKDVTFHSGSDPIHGHLAAPEGPPGPAIVLIPDVHGLSDFYRELAGRFAEEGIAALAIDLYSRERTPKFSSFEEIQRWIAELPDPRILGDLQSAVDWLANDYRAKRVGITGFCMGGQYALLAACSVQRLGACVSFYGMLRYDETNERKPRSPLDAAIHLTCPYLGIFGEEDAIIPLGDVEELRRRLDKERKSFEIRTYPGCGHAFVNHTRPDAYRAEAAEDALRRAFEFFRRHLDVG